MLLRFIAVIAVMIGSLRHYSAVFEVVVEVDHFPYRQEMVGRWDGLKPIIRVLKVGDICSLGPHFSFIHAILTLRV